MHKVKNYVGQKFGCLTVLERVYSSRPRGERFGNVDVIVEQRKWFSRSIFAMATQGLAAAFERSMD
jgi:hypothetical protein